MSDVSEEQENKLGLPKSTGSKLIPSAGKQ